MFVTSVVTAIGLGGGLGCATVWPVSHDPGPPGTGLPVLTWLAEFTRPSGATYPQLLDSKAFGSISGLAHDLTSGDYVGVIDDRADSRVAWMNITFAHGQLDMVPSRVQLLRAGPGVDARVATQADLEAIVALPDGTFVMAEEGHISADGVWPPALLQVTRDGLVTGVISFPPEFQMLDDGTRGVRDNQGFESLTRTPAGRLIAGLEQPVAPSPVTTPERGGDGRLVEFEPTGTTWKPGRQWQYTIAPTPAVTGFPHVCGGGENGLVELLAITETTLIAMERACRLSAAGVAANTIQLFGVTLSGNVARKTLLLDISTLTPQLSPALATLDNFEGLAFGPIVDGVRTLLAVSDDNFRASQKTSFLLFGMR